MNLELPSYDLRTPGGESDEARFIDREARMGRFALCETNTYGRAFTDAMDGLIRLQRDCHEPNWDGYGAEAVGKKSVWLAYLLLEALPPGLRGPTVGAEPDGHVTLEWHRSPWRTLSVSVSPNEELHYSALLGPKKQYGTEVFFGNLPATILDLIDQVYA